MKNEKMSATKYHGHLSMHVKLTILFLASFLIHTILNIWVNQGPTVVIDEGLYTNIARSLAWDGELAFRGQPVSYPYLLYPFLLVPIYWLNRVLGGDIYRFVQVFNTLLITSSVFPAYYFSKDYTKDEKKAFIVALIVTLMPDMIMGGYEMTECLLWPLALWMMFFSYRYYNGTTLKDGLLTALFAGLMFAAKPGAVAMGAVLLFLYLLKTIKTKKACLQAFLPILLLLAVIGTVYVIYLFFSVNSSILGLYVKQTSEWTSKDILVSIEACFLLMFLFLFSCGGIFGVYPFSHLKENDDIKRNYILSVVLGILTVIIGTAIFVVPYKWDGSLGYLPLHLRYCSMFIPAMIVFSIDQDTDFKKKSNKAFIISLVLVIILSIFPGARAGFVKGHTGTIDNVTLSAFVQTQNLNGNVTGWILTLFVVISVLLYISLYIEKKNRNKNGILYRFSIAYLVIFTLFNSVCAHVSANVYIDPTIGADVNQLNHMIGNKRCLGITQRYYDDIYSYWLDGRLNVPMQQVTIDQMFLEAEKTNGLYHPFVPIEQAPNINNHETPDTNTFVLGMTIAEHLELSDTTTAIKTDHGHFSIVDIKPETRWVDTMMYGLDDNHLYAGKTGYIHVFSDDRNIDGNIYLSVTASGNGTFKINQHSIKMSSQPKTYEITIPYSSIITLLANEGTISIESYSTRRK